MWKCINVNGDWYDIDFKTEDYVDFLIDERYVDRIVKGVSDDAKTQESIKEVVRKVVTNIVSNFDFIYKGVEDYATFFPFIEKRHREEFEKQANNDDI